MNVLPKWSRSNSAEYLVMVPVGTTVAEVGELAVPKL